MGRIIKVKYVWQDEPDAVLRGYVAVGCEQFPEEIDDMVMFYFQDEDEYLAAKKDFRTGFKILGEV